MSEQLDRAIAAAWKAHRQGNQDTAIKQYMTILEEHPENTDALYGMGLAQKAAGDPLGARASFHKLQKILHELLDNAEGDTSNRLQMVARMVEQQLEVLNK